MAVSKTSIANAALIEIGVERIISGETSEAQRLVDELFQQTLDEEIESDDWTFAIHRSQLAAESETPDFEYTYQHRLPSNPYCLRVLSEYNDYTYTVEGLKILSDSTPLQIRYIKRITDVTELSASFRKAFQFRLASILAIPLRGSRALKETMENKYAKAIAKAASKDSQQSTPEETANGSWLDARKGYY